MKKLLIISLILLSSLYADQITLSFVPVDSTQVDILMETDTDLFVAGFQFNVSGVTLTGASGGSSESAGFMVSAGNGTVLGMSLTGSTISDDGILTRLVFDKPTMPIDVAFQLDCWPGLDNDGCSNLQSFSDPAFTSISVILGNSFDFSGCNEQNAPEYESHNIFDDGSCSCYGADCLDCAGNVGGLATVNGCGACICNGEIPVDENCLESQDCVQGCDGQFYNDGNAPEDDSCGVCDGDGTSCLPVQIQFSEVNISDSELSIQLTNFQTINNILFRLSGMTDINILSNSDSFDTPIITDNLIDFPNGSLPAGFILF